MTSVEKSSRRTELLVDPRRVLVDRIAASEFFATSPRVRELFVYLAQCALRDPRLPVTEHQVGVAVFNRPTDYDTSYDTIVRVQASQVRKRLKYYFQSEGLHEPIVMELPKGSYLPVFIPRKQEDAASNEDVPIADEETRALAVSPAVEERLPAALDPLPEKVGRPAHVVALASLLAISVVLCGWLAYENAQLRKGSSNTPFLNHFWKQFFQNGQQTDLVPSDVSLVVLSDVLRRTVSLREYSDPGYPRSLADPLIADPYLRHLLTRPMVSGAVTTTDIPVLRDLSSLLGRYRIPVQAISTTKFLPYLDSSDNFILLGHKRANPWVELFESRMNFRHVYDDDQRRGMIVNRSPLPGEQSVYPVERGKPGYAVVACLPKPAGGNALLLFGAQLPTIDLAGNLVTDEASMAKLHSRLGAGLSTRLPYFEILVRPTPHNYESVALRILKNP